jgi:hypothetical protein
MNVQFKEGKLYESSQHEDFYIFEKGRMRKWNGMSFSVKENSWLFIHFKPSNKTIEDFKKMEAGFDIDKQKWSDSCGNPD